MSGIIISKRFFVVDELNQEIAIVTLEHLWADVFGLMYKRTEKNPSDTQWVFTVREVGQ